MTSMYSMRLVLPTHKQIETHGLININPVGDTVATQNGNEWSVKLEQQLVFVQFCCYQFYLFWSYVLSFLCSQTTGYEYC